jgi:hypothetical protein
MARLILRTTAGIMLSASLLLHGCVPLVAAGAGAAVAAGTVVYVEGKLETTYPASFDRTWTATMAALQDSTLQITEANKKLTEGRIQAQ